MDLKKLFVNYFHVGLYLLIPVLFWFLVAYFGYIGNYNTIHGRYQYIGDREMSMQGYLDLAHYRPIASQEFWGWQFFWGNLPYFAIFSAIMAGYFHLFGANMHARSHNISTTSDSPNYENLAKKEQQKRELRKKLLIVGLSGVAIVLVLEILAATLGQYETGWGPHIYIGP